MHKSKTQRDLRPTVLTSGAWAWQTKSRPTSRMTPEVQRRPSPVPRRLRLWSERGPHRPLPAVATSGSSPVPTGLLGALPDDKIQTLVCIVCVRKSNETASPTPKHCRKQVSFAAQHPRVLQKSLGNALASISDPPVFCDSGCTQVISPRARGHRVGKRRLHYVFRPPTSWRHTC